MKKEIEIRYKIDFDQRKKIYKIINGMGYLPVYINQQDVYFCAKKYKDKQETRKCPYVVRIRKTDKKAKLAYKSFQGGDGSSWIEIETDIGDDEVMSSILQFIDQEPYLEIKKKRIMYSLGEIEVNIDSVEGLGDFVEFEIMSENAELGRKKILTFVKSLGLSNKKIITKGYVQLMEETLISI